MTDDDTAPPLTEAAEAIARLAQIVNNLERQLGSARDWAVALEGQNAAALALHKPGPMLDHYEYGCVCGYTDHRWSECEGCGYVLDDEGELDREIHGRTCPTVAALTGGEDE